MRSAADRARPAPGGRVVALGEVVGMPHRTHLRPHDERRAGHPRSACPARASALRRPLDACDPSPRPPQHSVDVIRVIRCRSRRTSRQRTPLAQAHRAGQPSATPMSISGRIARAVLHETRRTAAHRDSQCQRELTFTPHVVSRTLHTKEPGMWPTVAISSLAMRRRARPHRRRGGGFQPASG
jgi:hypothetical protein